MLVGNRRDARRQRGGEERGLARGGCGLEDQLDVLGKAHVEHLVGLIEHDGLQGSEHQRAAADVIERAARCGHHHVHAALERLHLAPNSAPP